MIRILTLILSAVFAVAGVAPAQTIEQRVAALEQRVAALDGKSVTPSLATQPVPVVMPSVVTPPIVTLPVITPTPAGPVQTVKAATLSIKAGDSGKRFQLADATSKLNIAAGTVSNLLISTFKSGHDPQVVVGGNGVVVDGITFGADSGYCLLVSGSNATVRNFRASTFGQYGIYCQKAKNVTLDGVYITGWSASQSFVRFEESSGVLKNFVLDFQSHLGGAVPLRGEFTGRVQDGLIRGRVASLCPQDNLDEGQRDGITRFNGPYGLVSATNPNDCIAIKNKLIAQGVTDPYAICRATAAVAKINISLTDPNTGKVASISITGTQACDVIGTMAGRAKLLAKRSDVTWKNVVIEAPVRWTAGTKYLFLGGRIRSATLFDNCTLAYPSLDNLLPGDVRRPAPDVTFDGTAFESTKPMAAFLDDCGKLGVKRRNCTYNGVPTGAMGMFIGPVSGLAAAA